jgi:DNA-binding transcriptional LysR family regulator
MRTGWPVCAGRKLGAAQLAVQYIATSISICGEYGLAMDLRLIRYFVAVAEELHFTRAAERLGIRQPPLSQQIRQLELELGTPLFHRLARGVELTEAGAVLLDEGRRILNQVELTKANVQSRARGDTGRLIVGFAGATYFQPRVPKIVQAYRELYPQVLLSPEQSNTPLLIEGLLSGAVDVAFVRPPLTDGSRIAVQPVVEEPMRIVLPSGRPRAAGPAIPLAALAQEPFILFPRAIGPGLYDSIIASCQRAGFSPILGQEAPQIPSIVYLVAAGFGVSLVPQSIEQIHAEGVRYVPIEGEAPKAPIAVAYRKDDRRATVSNFVTLARRQTIA